MTTQRRKQLSQLQSTVEICPGCNLKHVVWPERNDVSLKTDDIDKKPSLEKT